MSVVVKLPAEVAQQIVNYLGGRPYREVFTLIEALRAAPIVDDEDQTGES